MFARLGHGGCLISHSVSGGRLSPPSKRSKASCDALLPGGHSCCHVFNGMSARGSNLLANKEYSRLRHPRRPPPSLRNAMRRSICARCSSGGAPPRTPIPFIRLCLPSANGRKPQRDPMDSLISRQSSQARHDQRDVPPAVARKQMMHRSNCRETSQSAHFCGESSSGHDCHRIGRPG